MHMFGRVAVVAGAGVLGYGAAQFLTEDRAVSVAFGAAVLGVVGSFRLPPWRLAFRAVAAGGAVMLVAAVSGVVAYVTRPAAAPPDPCVVGDWTAGSFEIHNDAGVAWTADTPTAGRLRLGADGRGTYTTDGGWVEFTSLSKYGNVQRQRVDEVATFGYATAGGTLSFTGLAVTGREGPPGEERTVPPSFAFMSLSGLISAGGGASPTSYRCEGPALTLRHDSDTMTLRR